MTSPNRRLAAAMILGLAIAGLCIRPAAAQYYPAFGQNKIAYDKFRWKVYKAPHFDAKGPLQLADFIGLDTCLSIMQVLYEGLADSKYRPCPLLVKYVEAGWLGRKTKRGFYDYRGEKPMPTR
jgi:hypothetical protein